MKKAICILFVLTITISGLAAPAATAIRGYDKNAGYVYVNLGRMEQLEDGTVLPIMWRVLKVENNLAYVCSEFILFPHRIHGDDKEWIATGADFRQTELWAHLNEEFLFARFTPDEQAMMVDTPDFGKLFLLTADDLKNTELGFGTNQSRKAWATPYALKDGWEVMFQYNSANGRHSPYWTMTQSKTAPYGALCTKAQGNLGYIRVVVENEGCRPAMYLDLSKVQIQGGLGTAEAPFELQLVNAQ
jgi:hypothetical protein